MQHGAGLAPLPHPVLGQISYRYTLDYLTWLRFANAGHFQEGNLAAMDYAIQRLPGDHPILEIGSFAGLSANQITALKRRHGKTNRLFTCDPWVFEQLNMDVKVGAHHVTFREYAEFICQTFVQNVKFFSSDSPPMTMRAFSDDFFRAWRAGEDVTDIVSSGTMKLGGPIGFAFIDGDHQYEPARRDFENVDEFLVPGGFVLFDDSGDDALGPDGLPWGSWRVAKEVEASGRYELIAKQPNYLFRKIEGRTERKSPAVPGRWAGGSGAGEAKGSPSAFGRG